MTETEHEKRAESTGAAERLDVEQWATRKGTPRWLVAAAVQHAGWPYTATPERLVRLVTESEFDAAVEAAAHVSIR